MVLSVEMSHISHRLPKMELALKRCCVFDISKVAEVGLAEDHFLASPSIVHENEAF